MRSNHWHFTSNPEETRHRLRGQMVLGGLLRPPEAVTLRLENAVDQARVFVVSPAFERQLWALHTMPLGTPEERQLAALLVNHHATVGGPYGQRDFGHQIAEQACDLYGVGSTRPTLWVLGEQLNPLAREYPMPFGTPTGRAMLWPHVNPWNVRVSNCLEPGESLRDRVHVTPRLTETWRELGEPFVLLLGTAAATLYKGGNVIGHLEHPQHVWRFQHALAPEWSAQFVHWCERAVEGIG